MERMHRSVSLGSMPMNCLAGSFECPRSPYSATSFASSFSSSSTVCAFERPHCGSPKRSMEEGEDMEEGDWEEQTGRASSAGSLPWASSSASSFSSSSSVCAFERPRCGSPKRRMEESEDMEGDCRQREVSTRPGSGSGLSLPDALKKQRHGEAAVPEHWLQQQIQNPQPHAAILSRSKSLEHLVMTQLPPGGHRKLRGPPMRRLCSSDVLSSHTGGDAAMLQQMQIGWIQQRQASGAAVQAGDQRRRLHLQMRLTPYNAHGAFVWLSVHHEARQGGRRHAYFVVQDTRVGEQTLAKMPLSQVNFVRVHGNPTGEQKAQQISTQVTH